MKLYSVRDRVSKLYGEPISFINSNVAVRDLSASVNDPSSSKVPFGDLDLYYVGEFDQKKGRFSLANDFIVCLADLKTSPNKEVVTSEDVSEE